MNLIKATDGRSEIHQFPGLRSHYGIGTAPPNAGTHSVLADMLDRANLLLTKYDDEVAASRANAHLTMEGIKAGTRELRQRAADAVALLRVNAERKLHDYRADRAALEVVPQLDPSDAVGAALDREIRENYAHLSERQRAEALADERVQAALMRSPFDNIPKQQALALHRQRVAVARADEVNALAAKQAAAEWYVSVAQAQQGVLDRTAAELGAPPQTAGDLAKALREQQVA